MHGIYTPKSIQEIIRMPATTANKHTTTGRQDIRVVQLSYTNMYQELYKKWKLWASMICAWHYTMKMMPYTRDSCIKFWTRDRTPTDKWWFVVSMRQSTWPPSIAPSSFCRQEPDKHRNKVQEKRKGNVRYPNVLQRFHHQCFTHEVSMEADHKLLVAIFKKDVTTLSQRLQQILLCSDQYRIRILCKPEPQL